jgi:hypothetical protein
MREPLVLACVVFAFSFWPAFSEVAFAPSERGRKACAAFDLNLVELIEDHGEAEDLDPVVLSGIVEVMVHARQACLHGTFDEAVSLYSTIALKPVPTRRLR